MKVWQEKCLANLVNFAKPPNFICQTFCNSTTIISILTLFCQIDFFTFSPNFSLAKLLSYTVYTASEKDHIIVQRIISSYLNCM